MVPTSKHHCPCPRSYTCSWVPASCRPTLGSRSLPRILDVRLDTASDPGEYWRRSPLRRLLPTGETKPSALTNQNSRGSTRSGSASPVTFAPRLLSCLRIDAHVTGRRKARYWARGSRLPRRDSYPLEHAALPGRTVPGIPQPNYAYLIKLSPEFRNRFIGSGISWFFESGAFTEKSG